MADSNLKIISGITMTPPTVGRIMLGHTEVKDGESSRGMPVKDDHFTITTLTQKPDRSWESHPINQKLNANQKLVAIPVRIVYNDPNLSLHNRYTCFHPKTGRTLCAGDGVNARRPTPDGVKTIECPRPEACEYGLENRCKSMSRFYIQIEGQEDELGVFVLRSSSYNSLDRLASRLTRLHGLTGGKIAGMPMLLTINKKTSAMSFRRPFWFVDLVQRPGMSLFEAIAQAKELQEGYEKLGLSQDRMEEAIRKGMGNSDFADEIEDLDEWLGDEAFAEEAEHSLQKQGLRGMDKLAAAASAMAQVENVELASEVITRLAEPTPTPNVAPEIASGMPETHSSPEPIQPVESAIVPTLEVNADDSMVCSGTPTPSLPGMPLASVCPAFLPPAVASIAPLARPPRSSQLRAPRQS